MSNLVDAVTPPAQVTDQTYFNLSVFLAGQKIAQSPTMTLGLLQVSDPFNVAVPRVVARSASAAPSANDRRTVRRNRR